MFPILILRAEVVCLVILVFLYFTSRTYQIDSDTKSFSRILMYAFVHVCFDIITVLTVNNTETVPAWINWTCHIIFYLSAILFSNEIANYVVALCYPRVAKKLYYTGLIITAVYLCTLPFLQITYVEDLGTYSSAGSAAVIGYGIGFLFFIAALTMILINLPKMTKSIKSALIPMMCVLIIVDVSQIFVRSLLFTGCAITIVTVGFFFSLENPVEVFKRKAMTDALTGVRSRASYEADIEKLDGKFREHPNDEFLFAFCDINDLRGVNNRFGHSEGDNYITLIASALSRNMKKASAVYRIGGDEFLVLYRDTEESVVDQELQNLQEDCRKTGVDYDYVPSISVGYARSADTYRSLKDVVKTADYAMYQNKSRMKAEQAVVGSNGTKLNYTGLTDKSFEVMCAANDRSYPFLTNLETNVTRIDPAWREYFGLESEFFADFTSIWEKRIHPDYLNGYKDNLASVINGHSKYHNYDYLVKNANGEYVQVTCHGSVYRDSSDNAAYFSGFLVNHGLDENIDAVTGLRNFDKLTSCVCTHMDDEKPFAVLKLKLNNFARVNMLYGYSGGNEIIKRVTKILTSELGDRGEVFCQGSVNFSILFECSDAHSIETYYNEISSRLAKGVETGTGAIPILLSGGAMINRGERHEIQDMRRSLVYALEESLYSQRNQLIFYSNRNEESSKADFGLLAEIHADVLAEMKYFQLRYQPIVDIGSRKTVGAEALLRWIHPEYGEVRPDQFIAFLENDPCYYRLGLGIIERAVRDAKALQKTIPEFRINVNVTALQLQNRSFADHVCEILRKYDFAPDGLVLELTERCKEMDSAFLASTLAELRSRGILVAFDDLGTGYSTISLLMDIPVDEIKLDKEFVRDLQTRESYQLFVRSLVLGASSSNNYTICFEGIENEEMLEFVGQYGQYLAQGYYFAKPLLIDDFSAYIEKNK